MGTLDTVQQEQLSAIGTYLSDVRQEQDRSLEEIAAKTYIPLRLLKALEAGQEKPLPEPVFIQGFIRRYADALGLDGIDLSQKFPVHVTPLPIAPGAAANRESRLRNGAEPGYSSAQVEDHEPSRRPQSVSQSNSFLPYVVAAGLLAVGGIGLGIVRAISSRQPNDAPRSAVVLPKQPTPTAQTSPSTLPSASSEPTASPSAVVRSASPSPSVNSSPTAGSSPRVAPSITAPNRPAGSNAASNAPVSVDVSLTGNSWVQVVVDGEVKAEGVLPRGTRQNWTGQREITIVAGNAGAVSVSQSGGAAKVMGAAGDVEEARFTPKSN